MLSNIQVIAMSPYRNSCTRPFAFECGKTIYLDNIKPEVKLIGNVIMNAAVWGCIIKELIGNGCFFNMKL